MAMRSRHLVDPELLPLLDELPPLELSDESLPAVRTKMIPLVGDPSAADAVAMDARAVPGPPGARLYREGGSHVGRIRLDKRHHLAAAVPCDRHGAPWIRARVGWYPS